MPKSRVIPPKSGSSKYTVNGKEYYRVSTILSMINNPALEAWKRTADADKVGKKARDIGSRVHELIERYYKNPKAKINISKEGKEVQNCWKAFLEFAEMEHFFQMKHSEETVWSDRYGYAGTLDGIGIDYKKRYILVDFKTSASVYDESKVQLSAYKKAWEERNKGKKIKYAYIVRLDKKSGKLELHRIKNIGKQFKIFKCAKLILDWKVENGRM